MSVSVLSEHAAGGVELSPRHLRNSLGRFATGVSVVTYTVDGVPRGATVNSFVSVSMDPPLVLVSIARSAKTAAALSGQPFVVNVLAADQVGLARQFAGQPQPGLEVPWSRHHQMPRLRGAVAWVDCQPYAEVEAGDHILVLGRVVDHRTVDKEPLLFESGKFRLLGEHAEAGVGGRAAGRGGLWRMDVVGEDSAVLELMSELSGAASARPGQLGGRGAS